MPAAALAAALMVFFNRLGQPRLVRAMADAPIYRAGIRAELERLIKATSVDLSPKERTLAAAAALGALYGLFDAEGRGRPEESRTSGGAIRSARHRLSGRVRAQSCRAVFFGDGITNRGNETMAESQNMIGTVDWERFGERVRREIEKTGLSLRGIESRLNGPSFTTLNRVCNGTSCTVETYLWLCREFSIGPKWAYRHEQKRRPPKTSRRLIEG